MRGSRHSVPVLLALACAMSSVAEEPGWDPLGWVGGGGGPPVANELKGEKLREELLEVMRPLSGIRAPDRHRLGRKLCPCRPTEKGAALVIAFEGTGAYEPLMPATLQHAHRRLKGRLAPDADVHRELSRVFEEITGREPRWSGLAAGPFATLLEEPALLGGSFDWFSFPSEEAEVLSGLDAIRLDNLGKLIEEVKASLAARPLPVENAARCTREYLQVAGELGYRPRIVVLSHSSGARSAVKLLELLKPDVTVDLVMTIDPVREAHEALLEVVGQLLRKGRRNLRVRSRPQPESLYKPSNARRHVYVMQRTDTEGLKTRFEFGIRGSSIHEADHGPEIRDLGGDAHGPICYHRETLELWRRELRRLVP